MPSYIQTAVTNEYRLPANIARDSERKGGEVISFFGVEPGMTVVDLAASRGYFTEILSGTVGNEGKIYAQYRGGERFETQKEQLAAHYNQFGNIDLIVSDPAAGLTLDLPDNSVDMVLLSLLIHHLHYDAENPDSLPERSKAIFKEIQRVLKPGGTFALIEHAAIAGASRKTSNDWHRIDPAMAKADLTSVGFVFDEESDIHTYPEDNKQNVWYETGLRGKTNRLVHRYKSPE